MKSKFLNISSLLFGLVLPLSTKLGNVALGCFLAILLYFIISERKKPTNVKPLFFSTIFLFILLIMGVFLSEHTLDAVNLFGRYVTYALVPLFLMFIDREQLKTIRLNALWGLMIGVLMASLILLTNNFINYYSVKPLFTIDKDLLNYYHTYHSFTKPLKVYPSYFGMYVLLALTYSLSVFFKEKMKVKRMFFGVSIAVFLLTILFLNSRVVIGLTAIVVFYHIFLLLKKSYFFNKKVFAIISLMIVFFGFLLFKGIQKTYLYSRFSQELYWDLTPNVNTAYNGKFTDDSRVTRWQAALDVIERKPFLGYGSAMEKETLHKEYVKRGLKSSAENGYDAHNQYLSMTIEFGILGLLLLLLFLGSNLYFASTSRNSTSLFFFLTLIFISLFENVFKNNSGIIFIAFYSNLFLFEKRKI